jgi:hypothetical protein
MQNSGIAETSLPAVLVVLVLTLAPAVFVRLAQVFCFTQPSYSLTVRIWPSLIHALDRSSSLVD